MLQLGWHCWHCALLLSDGMTMPLSAAFPVPLAQYSHVLSPLRYLPAWQRRHCVSCSPQVKQLALQFVHEVSVVVICSVLVAKPLFSGHNVHVPGNVNKYPALHVKHPESLPSLQTEQELWQGMVHPLTEVVPVTEPYPAGQSEQLVAPDL